jgi:alpha-glucosidase
VYYDHRAENGTHAIFLLNSNGMNVIIDEDGDGPYLEYNTLGGVLILYFMNAPTPKEASMQYAEVTGYPALMPWWGYGYHQCRYGMVDVWEVAGVIANYSKAAIPLETQWIDIDYMNYRRTLSLDPQRFALDHMREMVDYLHDHQQHLIMMVDPAVAHYQYEPFQHGADLDAFLKWENGSWYTGVVWVSDVPHVNFEGKCS